MWTEKGDRNILEKRGLGRWNEFKAKNKHWKARRGGDLAEDNVHIAEYFELLLDYKASEMTVYRRFAMILDYVFSNLDMTMQDDETVSEATKLAVEQNKHDTSNSFGSKIDLLLKIKDTAVELSCNEWKSAKMRHLLRQQSKNLCSNCAILNKLYITSQGKVDKIMAADIVDEV
ncbi:hypothetical protein DFQ29_005271 [Apophysomyces sp. BC1021]|nr:hypothetical protein DFQ29_005271 [Apophysomyces sp. BC1021]